MVGIGAVLLGRLAKRRAFGELVGVLGAPCSMAVLRLLQISRLPVGAVGRI